VVGAKLRNQRTMARRLCRSRQGLDERLVERITAAIQEAATARDMAALRGLEGGAARAYFGLFRQALEPGWGFEKRVRRPPGDPVNALLGLAYTLLGNSLMAALEVVGLDPYDGFFHADKHGRPALALDLVEEFRCVIGDSVVLTLVNKDILEKEDFEPGARGGIYLSQDGLRKFFRQYTARLNTRVQHPLAGRPLTYQQVFEVQARLMRKVIEGAIDRYRPFVAKQRQAGRVWWPRTSLCLSSTTSPTIGGARDCTTCC
jgi:CRISPR-associated protein Cas1